MQYELVEFTEVIERIKDKISISLGNRKVFDADVSKVLGINKINLATRKRRNSMPYEEIIIFCINNNIDIKELLCSMS